MNRRSAIGIALAIAVCLPVLGAAQGTDAVRFSDYPVHRIYRGRTARIKRQFLTAWDKAGLRDAAKKRADFAGHWIVAIGSCGAGCRSIGVVDARTGDVRFMSKPLIIDARLPGKVVDYRLESKLLILRGSRGEDEADLGIHFYVFEKGRFVLVRSLLLVPRHAKP